MKTKEDVLKALREVIAVGEEYCDSRKGCEGCIFAYGINNLCTLNNIKYSLQLEETETEAMSKYNQD